MTDAKDLNSRSRFSKSSNSLRGSSQDRQHLDVIGSQSPAPRQSSVRSPASVLRPARGPAPPVRRCERASRAAQRCSSSTLRQSSRVSTLALGVVGRSPRGAALAVADDGACPADGRRAAHHGFMGLMFSRIHTIPEPEPPIAVGSGDCAGQRRSRQSRSVFRGSGRRSARGKGHHQGALGRG